MFRRMTTASFAPAAWRKGNVLTFEMTCFAERSCSHSASKPSVFACTDFRIIKGLIAVVMTEIGRLSPKLWGRRSPDVTLRLVILEMGSGW